MRQKNDKWKLIAAVFAVFAMQKTVGLMLELFLKQNSCFQTLNRCPIWVVDDMLPKNQKVEQQQSNT